MDIGSTQAKTFMTGEEQHAVNMTVVDAPIQVARWNKLDAYLSGPGLNLCNRLMETHMAPAGDRRRLPETIRRVAFVAIEFLRPGP